MSTLRISNIEAKSVPASATVDEKVKITNSSGDTLVFIDGKTSGITTVGINTTDGNITFDANSNVVVTGIITATRFSGEITPTTLNVSGGVGVGDSIFHIGDDDTQIRFPAANTITFENGGTERLRLNSDGKLLLGSGSNSPSTLAGGFEHALQVQGTSAATASISIIRNSAAENPPYLTFGKSRGTSLGSNVAVQEGDVLGQIDFTGSDGSGSFNHFGKIACFADAATGNGDAPGRLSFYTTPDSSTNPQEVFTINRNGDSNFGTTTNQYGYRVNIQDSAALYAQTAASGGTELKLYLDHSNGIVNFGTVSNSRLAFVSQNVERFRITADGRFGFNNNTTDPLDIPATSHDTIVVGNSTMTSGGICLHGASASGNLGFQMFKGGSFLAARMLYERTSNELQFHSATGSAPGSGEAVRLQLKPGGNVQISDGDLVLANGHGIDFSATSNSGSGTNSELFDDYEEGSWVPGMAFGATDTGITYSSRSGSYVKIGRFVYCVGQLDLSNRGSSTGDATFTNLPFTVGDYVSGSSHEGSGQITWWQNTNTTDNWSFWISQGGTSATIYGTFGNGSGSVATTVHGHYQNNSAFRFHLSYMAA